MSDVADRMVPEFLAMRDEIVRLREQLAASEPVACPRWGTCFSHDCTCHPSAAGVSDDAKDAARYRFLRGMLRHAKWNDIDAIHELKPKEQKYISDANLDAALDSVIEHAASEGESGPVTDGRIVWSKIGRPTTQTRGSDE